MGGNGAQPSRDASIDKPLRVQYGAPPRSAKLEDTDWKFVQFGNRVATEDLDASGIYFRLRSHGKRMRVFDGCNVIFGRYELNDQKLRFLIVGVTEWTCTKEAEQRRALLNALKASSRWNILGDQLELYDVRSEILARFETHAAK
jgi:heat shock protein HslJ